MRRSLSVAPPAGSTVAELYQCYRPELVRYVIRTFGRTSADPEDLIQTAFAQYAALPPATVENPRAFLYRIVHNAAVQHLRKRARRSKLDANLMEEEDISDDWSGERVLMARERYRIVEATIRAMETTRRKVLIMHRIHGLSFADIARRTGISQTQVKRLVADAVIECESALRRAQLEPKE